MVNALKKLRENDVEIKIRIFEAIDTIIDLKDLEYYCCNDNDIYKGKFLGDRNKNMLVSQIKNIFINNGILEFINKEENFNTNDDELFSYVYCLRQKFSQ